MTNPPAFEGAECPADELAFWGPEDTSAHEFLLQESAPPVVYDLSERTACFGEKIILFAKQVPWGPVNHRLVDQLVGAGTSVGANYCEAEDGVSRADFKHRISICRKEARETKFFLRMVATSEPSLKTPARELWKEAHALHLIFSRIWRRTKL